MRKERPNLNSKAGRYVIARVKGKNKTQAALSAGYSESTAKNAGSLVETSKEVQSIKAYYRDKLLGRISLDSIAEEHLKIVLQDDDRSAKLRAIELALDKIEPENIPQEEDKILVVLG